MNGSILRLENISDEEFNEMLSAGWRLLFVDHFHKNQVVYNFIR